MKENKNTSKSWIIIAAVVTSIIIIGSWLINLYWGLNKETNYRGTFGDMFGAVNALYSGLALAGIIITLWLQQKELKSQKREIDDQKKEVKLQRFETAFFNTLNAHKAIVSETYIYDEKGNKINGIRAFEHIYKEILSNYDSRERDSILKYIQENNLLHYFKYTYRIIKWINNADLGKESNEENDHERYQYVKIFRSTISIYELLLIYYFGLSEQEKIFKHLIEKYSFLKNVPTSFKRYRPIPSAVLRNEDLRPSLDYHLQAFQTKPDLEEKFKRHNMIYEPVL